MLWNLEGSELCASREGALTVGGAMELRTLKQEAGDLLARGKFAQAEVLYRQMLLLNPRDAQLWVRHGDALKRLGRIEEAVDSYRRASSMLSEAGHLPRAVAALRLALELQHDNLDLISELIRMELKKNQRDPRAPFAQLPAQPRIPTPDPDSLLALPVLDDPITDPGITIEVLPRADEWPQVRRISACAVALKPAPDARWVMIESDTELRVTFADSLVESEDDDALT
jgi:tetratricopeptide (TPR) repeat protein